MIGTLQGGKTLSPQREGLYREVFEHSPVVIRVED
jgi:hypothetical protein